MDPASWAAYQSLYPQSGQATKQDAYQDGQLGGESEWPAETGRKSVKKERLPGDWLCPGCGDGNFARNTECRKCSMPKVAGGFVQPTPEQAQDMKEGDWICPGCNDLQFARNLECRKCQTANPRYARTMMKQAVNSTVATAMSKDRLLAFNWQNPWQAKDNLGLTARGQKIPEHEAVICSVHKKRRSVKNMIDDGHDGWKCPPGAECQVGVPKGFGKGVGTSSGVLWMPGQGGAGAGGGPAQRYATDSSVDTGNRRPGPCPGMNYRDRSRSPRN